MILIMKTYFFLLLIISFSARAVELPDVIRKSLNNDKNIKLIIEHRADFLKTEYFLHSKKIKNNIAIFETEFINFTLKNPAINTYTRYPINEKSLKESIILMEDKQSELNPLSIYLSELILIELKKYRQIPYFKDYLTRIQKSYYFTTKELKRIDKRMHYIEPWLKFFVESSTRDINQILIGHTIRFINHFGLSAEFILNEKLKIDGNQKLSIFADTKNLKINIPIEKKLDQMIETSASTVENHGISKQVKLQVNKEAWSPKDESELKIKKDVEVNLNIKDNYPKPSPNYLPPSKLPIPMNDW